MEIPICERVHMRAYSKRQKQQEQQLKAERVLPHRRRREMPGFVLKRLWYSTRDTMLMSESLLEPLPQSQRLQAPCSNKPVYEIGVSIRV